MKKFASVLLILIVILFVISHILSAVDHTLSHALFDRARQIIPGGVNSPVRAFRGVGGEPFFVNRAQGARIWDLDGNEYIDYVGTWGPAILGHAPKVVIEAIAAAAARGVSFGIPNPYEVEMAELICQWVPSIEKVRMVNSGTEATMSCIRLARGFTGREKIIKFEGCYHGHVDSLLVKAGSGALTHGQPDSAGVPGSFADLTVTLPFNDPTAIRSIFMAEGSKIAAVILEPIPANAGLYFPEPGFLELLRQQCSEYGAVLIFDEVMTGFRVARGGAQELYGVPPDLTALGKVIGGGLPVGAFGGARRSWIACRRSGPFTRRARFPGIRWLWLPAWRNCGNWSGWMAGASWKRWANGWKRKRAGPLPGGRTGSLFTGSARCFVSFFPGDRLPRWPPPSGATGRRSENFSTGAWRRGCTSPPPSLRLVFFPWRIRRPTWKKRPKSWRARWRTLTRLFHRLNAEAGFRLFAISFGGNDG